MLGRYNLTYVGTVLVLDYLNIDYNTETMDFMTKANTR